MLLWALIKGVLNILVAFDTAQSICLCNQRYVCYVHSGPSGNSAATFLLCKPYTEVTYTKAFLIFDNYFTKSSDDDDDDDDDVDLQLASKHAQRRVRCEAT